ncbi:hypothetical protein PAXRUDRAFT_754040 [Paxillus rubicundulus Ve08.2h10]|uniref:Uncharacterized protein n=1 Tax=Paxillus rubicundulus Ve08.2h10 TaxID=930991 RepID=A0A0D0DBP9_9AGAM|nr:hypothetical protein PAXRUDRAFT_754040 [Paxillus rubicundulus Ve08.2h10]
MLNEFPSTTLSTRPLTELNDTTHTLINLHIPNLLEWAPAIDKPQRVLTTKIDDVDFKLRALISFAIVTPRYLTSVNRDQSSTANVLLKVTERVRPDRIISSMFCSVREQWFV